MPLVITPGALGPPPCGSAVSPPPPQPPPCPRLSISRCAYPALAHQRDAPGRSRPPLYPTYSTTAGRGPSVPRGVVSQAEIRSPAKPRNVTSCTATVSFRGF